MMIKYFLSSFIFLIPILGMAQTDSILSEPEVFSIVETMPEFPGGQREMTQFIQRNVEYPEVSRENEIQGKVYVNFTVDRDGSIIDTRIIRGVDSLIDAEALRVINSMPKWKPGTQRGKNVKIKFTLPINFALD